MRRNLIGAVAAGLAAMACLCQGTDLFFRNEADDEQEEAVESEEASSGESAAPDSEATPYPTLPAQSEARESFILENIVVPAGTDTGLRTDSLLSDAVPPEAFTNLVVSGLVSYYRQDFAGDGVVTAAIYQDEATATQIFQAWQAYTDETGAVGDVLPFEGGGQFHFRIRPPFPNTTPDKLGYQAHAYHVYQRCRSVVSVYLVDREAGGLPVPPGQGRLDTISYLNAREQVIHELEDSGTGTIEALEDIACADDLEAALATVSTSESAGASDGSPLAILSEFVQGEGEDRVITGEVVNNGLRPVLGIEFAATFYDASGQVVGSEFGVAARTLIKPGERSPFSVYSLHVAAEWATYELEIARFHEVTDESLAYQDFAFGGDKMEPYDSFSPGPSVIVTGEVKNTGDRSARVIVTAALYDASDTLVGFASAYADEEVLAPGSSSPFKIIVYDVTAEPDHYELYGEGLGG